ncbi:DUF1697 domain-containing protein [Streptomyces albidoflavus]|uniref:DUF1697 domain-containing protein n=1 Tax=Streptomyces albidoflavus TaxID=1886 RepID=UPI003411B477
MRTEQTHIAFLRAVNVGGRKVEMARLREVLTGLGLGSPRTYIASGNAFFTTEATDHADLVGHIEAGLADAFGFPIPTILRTVPELQAELTASPFAGRQPAADERFSMVFTSGPLPANVPAPHSSKGDWEVLGASGSTAYVRWQLRNGRSVNPAPMIEKAYGVQATARFFHTTEKILAAAEKA